MTFLVYLVCFGVGLLFTLVSALASHLFGGGHDADVHADVGAGADGHDMPGFSPLSPTIIASFITAFGGLGMVFSKIEATSSPWISAPLALLGGFVIAAGVLMLFRSIFRATQSSSESQVASLTGQTASVITPIPAGAVGEIAYGRTVKITRVIGSQFYVVAI